MKLFKHQEEGIAFLKKKGRAILADEMGLGKTRQAIIAIGDDYPVQAIVICPASLKINWKREILMVYPQAKVHTIESGKIETLKESEWTIVNYDMLPKYKDQILNMIAEGKLNAGIIDEAHYIKGNKTIRSKTTLEIVGNLTKVYALTGTPIMNRPIELFNLLKAIKHPLGRARTVYAKRYCGAYMKTIILKGGRILRFFDESGATHLEELREFTRDSILRRMKKDVLNLPPKIIQVQVVELSKESRKEYDEAFDRYVEWIANNPELGKSIDGIMDARHLVELIKLKQVCSRAKIARIVSDIRSAIDQDQKVIVFSQFTGTIMAIRDELMQQKRGTRYDDAKEPILSVTLTGQDGMDSRQRSVDMFQSGPAKVFIANIKAGGVGITLTAGTQVKFADMEWSPELHSQAEDRAHRIGQSGTVNIDYYIAADTIEEDIVDILEKKRAIISELMNGGNSERWAKEMQRIQGIENEEERSAAYEALSREMAKESKGQSLSMASEFLERMKEKLHIHN